MKTNDFMSYRLKTNVEIEYVEFKAEMEEIDSKICMMHEYVILANKENLSWYSALKPY